MLRTGALDGTDDGAPLLNVVFCTPQIPNNTGGMGRTVIGLGARLHLVEPLGFKLDDKNVKRAGLDYWNDVDLRVHASWEAFLEREGRNNRRYFFTRAADVSAVDAEFVDDCVPLYMFFGSEISGFPDAVEADIGSQPDDLAVGIPMQPNNAIRCYNLQVTATMALWQAYYQMSRAAKI